ncbi:MAG: hypothetical protein ACQ9MH_14605 [Nitrospinales bacterium]
MIKKRAITALLLIILCLSSVSFTAAAKGDIGKGDNPDTGDLYGDLYVILRNDDGVPILDENGCLIPLAADGSELSLDYDEEDGIICEPDEDTAALLQGVDFGRLNEGRAPQEVIDHAFDEAINMFNSASDIALDPAGRIMLFIEAEWKTIDSPLENIALYIKMMKDGHWITTDTSSNSRGGKPSNEDPRPVLSGNAITLLSSIEYGNLGSTGNILNSHDLLLAASLLAAGGDKSGSITLDMVMYINSIYGINQDPALLLEVQDKTYFNFGGYSYDRAAVYGQRAGGGCDPGMALVLIPEGDLWREDCVDIQTTVTHISGIEEDNVRGFVQSADDALQVIEFIHNFRVPEELPVIP